MNKQFLISLVLVGLMVLATLFVIVYGKGYRIAFNGSTPEISGTGLLVTTSEPNGAQVFVDDHLTTATDNTINLAPGEYKIKIYKEGYFPWEKKIIIKKEVVSKADALLIPTAPKLDSVTNFGIKNPILDPTRTKIAYTVASQSATKNGIYVLDMTLRPILTLQNSSNQLVSDVVDSFSESNMKWSPDGKQLLVTTKANFPSNYLLTTDGLNENPSEVSQTISAVNNSWETLKNDIETKQIDSLNRKLRPIVRDNFNIIQWSDDETKILYTASKTATLANIIKPPLIGTNSTPEVRDIQKGSVYLYDIKEDRNYKLLDSLPKRLPNSPAPIMISPDSKHLIYVHDKKIDIMEYDGQNQTTLYAGPFIDNLVFPWPDATRIVILTNLGNLNNAPNLYTISLK